jgi:hypothetical protein
MDEHGQGVGHTHFARNLMHVVLKGLGAGPDLLTDCGVLPAEKAWVDDFGKIPDG